MNFFEELDKSDEKIRKQWIKYSTFYFLAFFALIFFSEVSVLLFFPENKDAWELDFLQIVIEKIPFLISFGIIYYFAYKKFGTKWITIVLFCGFIKTIIIINLLLNSPNNPELSINLNTWDGMIEIVGIILWMRWYILTWRLRQLNRRMKLKRQFPEDSKFGIDTLAHSISLEELSSNFTHILRTSPQIEPILSYVYEKKKKWLIGN
jgi:hypothetical protein